MSTVRSGKADAGKKDAASEVDASSAAHQAADQQRAAAEWVDIAALHPWPDNPRKNDGEPVRKVADSIKRFGFGAPIVARRANGEIIAGHTRWLAAIQLGHEKVPCRYVDLSESEAHLLALADNKLNELAPWDEDAVRAMLAPYSAADAEVVGFEEMSTPPPDLVVSEFDVAQLTQSKFWITVTGPVGKQPDAIEKLRAALASIEGVEVEFRIT